MVDTNHLNMNEIVTMPSKSSMFVVLMLTDYLGTFRDWMQEIMNALDYLLHTYKISKVKFRVHNKILLCSNIFKIIIEVNR